RDRGVLNIRLAQGAAERLPFVAGAFDAVVTRYSIHHFAAPLAALREMARVCRPGGRVIIIDMVAEEDAALAARQNELERVADGTHTAMLAPSALVALVVAAGLRLDTYPSRDVEVIFDRWQSQLPPDAAPRQQIRAALEAELAGGAETGFRPFRRDGALIFHHLWGIAVARRPGSPNLAT